MTNTPRSAGPELPNQPQVLIRHAIPDEYSWWRDDWLSRLPDHTTLSRGLSSVLLRGPGDFPEVIDREINMSWSTSPTEIVTCDLGDNVRVRVLVKYDVIHAPGAHRHGVAYEAKVYEQVLTRSSLPTPTWFGTFTDHAARVRALVIGYIPDGIRLHKMTRPGAPQQAARAIARFHSDLAGQTSNPDFAFLQRHEASYYLEWSRRMYESTAAQRTEFSWLHQLHQKAAGWIERLMQAEKTIVHGEYFPDNIIVADDVPRGVDWETTAVAPGEIDLACLTSGNWPASLVRECEAGYVADRWNGHAPITFEPALAAARIYLHCRSLGESPEEAARPWQQWRYGQLRNEAESLDLI